MCVCVRVCACEHFDECVHVFVCACACVWTGMLVCVHKCVFCLYKDPRLLPEPLQRAACSGHVTVPCSLAIPSPPPHPPHRPPPTPTHRLQMCVLDGNQYDQRCVEGRDIDADLESCSLLLNNKASPLLAPGGGECAWDEPWLCAFSSVHVCVCVCGGERTRAGLRMRACTALATTRCWCACGLTWCVVLGAELSFDRA
jgi:hypothetical protein